MFIHAVAYARLFFLIKAEKYSIVCIQYFYYSSANKILGYFHISAIVNNEYGNANISLGS